MIKKKFRKVLALLFLPLILSSCVKDTTLSGTFYEVSKDNNGALKTIVFYENGNLKSSYYGEGTYTFKDDKFYLTFDEGKTFVLSYNEKDEELVGSSTFVRDEQVAKKEVKKIEKEEEKDLKSLEGEYETRENEVNVIMRIAGSNMTVIRKGETEEVSSYTIKLNGKNTFEVSKDNEVITEAKYKLQGDKLEVLSGNKLVEYKKVK